MDTLGNMVRAERDLRQRIMAMEQRHLLTTREMNEKYDTDFATLHRHIVKIENDIVNLKEEVVKKDARIASLEKKKEGEQTDARLARLDDEEILEARIQNARLNCKSQNTNTKNMSVTTLFLGSRNLPQALGPPERRCHCKCGCCKPLPAENAKGRRHPTTQCYGCGCTICSYCVHLAISSIVACHECSRGGECK